MNLKSILERRQSVYDQMRRMKDTIDDAETEFGETELAEFQKLSDQFDDLTRRRDALVRSSAAAERLEREASEDDAKFRLADNPHAGRHVPIEERDLRGRSTGSMPVPTDPRETRALEPGESVAEYLEARAQAFGKPLKRPEVGFGAICRAMLCGPRNEAEARALSEGVDSAGGFTVPSILSAELIDRLRARTHVIAAGARTVPLESDSHSFARLATDPTVAWRAENASISASDPTFENVEFKPKTLVALVRASRELVEDSVNIEEAIGGAFAGAIAGELDRAALAGSGAASEPTGLRNLANVNQISKGVNGGAITNYDDVLDLVKLVLEANAQFPTAAIMAPRTLNTISKFKDTTNQPLEKPPSIEDMRMLATTNVSITETQGTANNASTLYLGFWPELWIGIRTSLRVQVLRELYADSYQTGFLAALRADIATAHPQSFGRLIGITP